MKKKIISLLLVLIIVQLACVTPRMLFSQPQKTVEMEDDEDDRKQEKNDTPFPTRIKTTAPKVNETQTGMDDKQILSTEEVITEPTVTTVTPEVETLPVEFTLSQLAIGEDAQEYLDIKAGGQSNFILEEEEGWNNVIIEIMATSSNWKVVPHRYASFVISLLDTGGYERTGKIVGTNTSYNNFSEHYTYLPPGASMKFVVCTSIPENQQPDKIKIKWLEQDVIISISELIEENSDLVYQHPNLEIIPEQIELEIQGKAKILFDIKNSYLVDWNTFSYERPYSLILLYIPTRIENLDGYDHELKELTEGTIFITGFNSNYDYPYLNRIEFPYNQESCPSSLPPGRVAECDVIFVTFGKSLKWVWFQVHIFEGTENYFTYQLPIDSFEMVGINKARDHRTHDFEWYGDPPPSQQE